MLIFRWQYNFFLRNKFFDKYLSFCIYTQQQKKRHYVSLSNTFKPLILKRRFSCEWNGVRFVD